MGTIRFVRLTEVAPDEILAHMNDPRVAEFLPLMVSCWTAARVAEFVATKEATWAREGLGHWAVLADGTYVGWGGFERAGAEWEFGLVLKPTAFGLGHAVTRRALEFARADPRISVVSFLMSPHRPSLRAFDRLGAVPQGDLMVDGEMFRKFVLPTG